MLSSGRSPLNELSKSRRRRWNGREAGIATGVGGGLGANRTGGPTGTDDDGAAEGAAELEEYVDAARMAVRDAGIAEIRQAN